MLRQTVDRLGDLVPNERRLIVTNKRLVETIREQLPELPAAAIVGEPCKRDTAPCIGLAALLGQPRRSGRDDGRDAGGSCDSAG